MVRPGSRTKVWVLTQALNGWISNHLLWKSHLPFCHPERSRGICGAPRLPHKGLGSHAGSEWLDLATTFYGKVTSPFVIPSAAEGSVVRPGSRTKVWVLTQALKGWTDI